MAAEDDVSLLDKWARGETEAAAELTRRHFDGLYGFFRSKVHSEVEDLVHDTLLRCLQARRRGTEVSDVRAYLFGVARNLLYDRLRKRKHDFDAASASLVDLGPTPSAALAGRERERLLLEALRSVPVDVQVLLELYYWERLSAAQLGKVYDVPEGTVRSRLQRAKELLTRRIGELAGRALTLHETQTRLDQWAARQEGASDPEDTKTSTGGEPKAERVNEPEAETESSDRDQQSQQELEDPQSIAEQAFAGAEAEGDPADDEQRH